MILGERAAEVIRWQLPSLPCAFQTRGIPSCRKCRLLLLEDYCSKAKPPPHFLLWCKNQARDLQHYSPLFSSLAPGLSLWQSPLLLHTFGTPASFLYPTCYWCLLACPPYSPTSSSLCLQHSLRSSSSKHHAASAHWWHLHKKEHPGCMVGSPVEPTAPIQ